MPPLAVIGFHDRFNSSKEHSFVPEGGDKQSCSAKHPMELKLIIKAEFLIFFNQKFFIYKFSIRIS